MSAQADKLTVRLQPGIDDDVSDIERLYNDLIQEIRALDVERVDELREGEAPAGAKGDAANITAILIALVAANGVLPTLISSAAAIIKGRADRSITMELNGKKLVLSNITKEEQQRLVREWIYQVESGSKS